MLKSWLRRAVATVRACGTIAALAFAASAGAAPITTWTYGSSSLQFLTVPSDGTGPLIWAEYAFVPVTVAASPLANGLKMYGSGSGDRAFALTGETYIPGVSSTGERGNRLVIRGTGTIDGAAWRHPQDLIRTAFAYGAEFSAGSLDIYEASSSYELRDIDGNPVAGVGSSGNGGYFSEPGAYGSAFAFEDRFGGDISAAVSIVWQVAINFEWQGYGESDTLTFAIPQSSIDIEAVPSPGAVVLAAAGCLAGMPPRRRR